jgi:anaerobic magnesium-protoporphyrin IX monomethyl ester cyclase
LEVEVLKKVGLLTPPAQSHRTAEETLALGYLASILRQAGYSVTIVDGWLEGLSAKEITTRLAVGGSPDLVGISCYYSGLDRATEVLKAVRDRFGNIPSICGGYGPTFHPELFLNAGFSVAVLGEAEHIIVRLVNALFMDRGCEEVPGIAYQTNGRIVKIPCAEPIAELDSIQFPSRDTITRTIEQKNFVHIATSRGCTGHCHFCSVFAFGSLTLGQSRWRGRSIQNIVAELAELKRRYGASHFKFVDDSFIEPPRDERWAYAFCEELYRRELSIRFRTQVRADRLTPELVAGLKQAGWFSTSIGIENGSATALKRMGKSASQAENLDALSTLEQNGIYVQMGMILFDPQTTLGELEENLIFLRAHPWPVSKGIFTEMYAAEGTLFTKQLHRSGNLLSEHGILNYGYLIENPQTRRAYTMLKRWHRSHSVVYDWTIDALTAPKILPDEGYASVYALCRRLQELDLEFFESVLGHIAETPNASTDSEFTSAAIERNAATYSLIERAIGRIYHHYGLCYTAEPNPFLGDISDHGPGG